MSRDASLEAGGDWAGVGGAGLASSATAAAPAIQHARAAPARMGNVRAQWPNPLVPGLPSWEGQRESSRLFAGSTSMNMQARPPEASGVSAKMIRYYEQAVGLIRQPRPHRLQLTANLPACEVDELRFLRRARLLGFSMEEIAQQLSVVGATARGHSREVKRDRRTPRGRPRRPHRRDAGHAPIRLRHLAHACAGDERPDCPILERFGGLPLTLHCRSRRGFSLAAGFMR